MDDGTAMPPGGAPSDIAGFYGPGSLIGWFLIVASTVVTAVRDAFASSSNNKASTLLVAEMTAALFYPLVAAGDLCVKLASRSRNWPAVRAVLAQPYDWIFAGIKDESDYVNHPPWDSRPAQKLISECMSLVLPLAVIMFSTGVLVTMFIICFLFPVRLRRTCQLILLGSFVFVILDALVALNMAMDSPFWFMMKFAEIMYLAFACLFLIPLCTIPTCLFCPAAAYWCFITLAVELRQALRRPFWFGFSKRSLRKGALKLAFWTALFIIGAIALTGPPIMVVVVLPNVLTDNYLENVPFAISELDQWAAMCSGAITFAFSAYEAVPWRVLISHYVSVYSTITGQLWEDRPDSEDYENVKMEA